MADSSQVFSAWAKARQSAKHRPLSAESVQAYRSVWNVWCEFLASCTLPWAQAQSADVHRFLSNLPASKSGRAAATTVTQARYARLLRQIYAFAVVHRWAERNPVDRQALTSTSEAHDSLVFNSSDWKPLLRALAGRTDAAHLQALTAGRRWQSLRDASVLRTMMQAGLTVGEIRALNLQDVTHARLRWVQGRPELAPALPPGQLGALEQPRLAIEGGREAQARLLRLDAGAGAALLAWLQLRCTLPCPLGPASPLYVSQRGKGAGRLSAKALFVMANDHIKLALKDRYSVSALAHAGPMTLRSSCIVRWLDAGMSDAKVIERAGLKDPASMRRLRKHARPSDPAGPSPGATLS